MLQYNQNVRFQFCFHQQCVASHTKGLPIFQGNNDMPSGLLPSSRAKPFGSKTAGTPTATRARRIIEILSTYDNTQWSGYGARATERVLRRRCPELHNATSGDCQGLSIYSSELFYPIGFSEAHLLVRGGPLKKINVEPYTYHIWNLVTKMFTIRPNSAYVQLASKLCPLIYGAYGDAFGV
ncbi:hypothetical protein B5X24_HaOG203048 [Helicoverpa armigera]|uniref:Alpha 1,4-glycosyltransferase domain-containing protein n=1 Tax=Helicoverpa armigera TaxID=29058 RepID=A0A2W1BRT1_HELAM|nr:hypothetical protein B5X24_HaOG203048 [Helicoverpa armigera]